MAGTSFLGGRANWTDTESIRYPFRTHDRPGTGDGRRSRWDAHRRTRRDELVEAAVRAVRSTAPASAWTRSPPRPAPARPWSTATSTTRATSTSRSAAGRRPAGRAAHRPRSADETEPRRQLASAIDAYLRIIEADPEVYRFVVRRPLPDRPVRRRPGGRALDALVGAHVAGVIAERLDGRRGRQLVPPGRGATASSAWSAPRPTTGSTSGTPMSRDALRDHLTDLVWAGLAGVLAATGARSTPTPPTRRPA